MFPRAALRQAASKTATLRRWIHPTPRALEKKVVMVPTMGDSITEGTIVEWAVEIGQAVKTDDVVALVETDKVTIEIKADIDGVLTQQFGSVDETVAVGAKLYEIDTDATSTVTAESSTASKAGSVQQESPSTTTPSPPAKEASPTPADTTSSSSSSSTPHSTRSASIQFLGKEGWTARKLGQTQTQTPAPTETAQHKPHAVTVIQDDAVRHPMYGRPPFTEEEVEALIWGGANLVADWKIKH